jgi:hypothetical protein
MHTKLLISFTVIVFAFLCLWYAYVSWLPTQNESRAEEERLAAWLAPTVGTHRLITYGPTEDRFGRRLALGYFLGQPVIFVDHEENLLDYLQSGERLYALMKIPVARAMRRRFPPSARSAGRYRFDDDELILIINR